MKRILSLFLVMVMILSLGLVASSCTKTGTGQNGGNRRQNGTSSVEGESQAGTDSVASTDASTNDTSSTASTASQGGTTSRGQTASQGGTTSQAGTNNQGGNNQGGNASTNASAPQGMTGLSAQEVTAITNTGHVTTYTNTAPSQSLYGGGNESFKDKAKAFADGFHKYFEENYNGTIEYIPSEFGTWAQQKFPEDFVAGTAPTLIFLWEQNWPLAASRGYVHSVEDLEENGVLLLDNPALDENKAAVQELYTWMGERYTFACNMVEPDVIFVNETFFKNLGITSPSTYYKNGQWTMDKLVEVANQATQKTAQGQTYGFYTWDKNIIVGANNGQLVSINKNASSAKDAMKVGINDTATKNGLEYVYDLMVEKPGWYMGSDNVSDFKKNMLGMKAWLPRNEANIQASDQSSAYNIKTYGFDWDIVPVPLGSDNKQGYRTCKCYSYAVSKAATTLQQQQGAVNYIIAYETYTDIMGNTDPLERDSKALAAYYTAEQMQVIKDSSKKLIIPFYTGIGTLNSLQWEFWGNLEKNGVAANNEAYYSAFEKQIRSELEQAV